MREGERAGEIAAELEGGRENERRKEGRREPLTALSFSPLHLFFSRPTAAAALPPFLPDPPLPLPPPSRWRDSEFRNSQRSLTRKRERERGRRSRSSSLAATACISGQNEFTLGSWWMAQERFFTQKIWCSFSLSPHPVPCLPAVPEVRVAGTKLRSGAMVA